MYHSTLGLRVIKKKKKVRVEAVLIQCDPGGVDRCRTNLAHIRQSRPDSGLEFQVKVLKRLKVGFQVKNM